MRVRVEVQEESDARGVGRAAKMLALIFGLSLPVWLIVEEWMRLRSDKMPARAKRTTVAPAAKPLERVLARSA
jgi:peptidoglycan/LPS O-acetylase OafA/YrhL